MRATEFIPQRLFSLDGGGGLGVASAQSLQVAAQRSSQRPAYLLRRLQRLCEAR